MPSEILVTTTPTLPGYEILRIIGPVYGMTIRSRGVGGRFIVGIEGLVGGEITSYVSELENARRESLQRLTENAQKMGANAVLSTDFETSAILQGGAILFSAYGTAVIAQPLEHAEATSGQCPKCGVENLPDARFCTNCGTALR